MRRSCCSTARTNSEWWLGALAVVLVVLRHRWRQVVLVAAVPLLVVATWTAKDLVLFGTTTTSSWFGMNLGRDVLFRAPAERLSQLERQGVLTPLASIPAFSDPHVYAPRYARLRPDPDPALGALYKANGAPNFNNPVYIPVASQYLHEDLAFIRADPGRYAADVGSSVQVWLVGTDQNFTNSANWPPSARLRPPLRPLRRVAAGPGPRPGARRVPAEVAPAGVAVGSGDRRLRAGARRWAGPRLAPPPVRPVVRRDAHRPVVDHLLRAGGELAGRDRRERAVPLRPRPGPSGAGHRRGDHRRPRALRRDVAPGIPRRRAGRRDLTS